MATKYDKCPECGAETGYRYEASLQEYPGAKVWPASHSWECPNDECGWAHYEDGDCIEGQENTRGW
jgi:hypothetical protein